MKYLIYLSLILIATSFLDFRVSDADATEALRESDVALYFNDLMIGNQTIHYAYTDKGKNALAIFIHGSPGSWNAFIDFFKTDSLLQDLDILSIDRPGFGQSNYGEAEPSLQKQAYCLNEVTKRFPHQKKVLIGHSLGGPVIARMAMDYPNDYRGLVFVAASIDPKMEKEEWYRNLINTKLGGWLTPTDFEVSNEEILALKKELRAMLDGWKKITVPSVVIHGTGDNLVPIENADFAEKMLENSCMKMIKLENVNHFIPWTHPQEVKGAIHFLVNAP